jgi:hypothetical protein
MKSFKNMLAIVALCAMGSANAKTMTPKKQPAVQPVFSERAIREYIDKIFDENDAELRDMLITDYYDYDKQEICQFIKDLAQFIAHEFPMYIPTAKKLFKDEMIGFCDSVKNDTARMTFIKQCIDSSMTKVGQGTRNIRKMDRLSRQAK